MERHEEDRSDAIVLYGGGRWYWMRCCSVALGEVAIRDVGQRRDWPSGGGEQEANVVVDVLFAAVDLRQQAELRVGDGGDVEERRFP